MHTKKCYILLIIVESSLEPDSQGNGVWHGQSQHKRKLIEIVQVDMISRSSSISKFSRAIFKFQ